MSTDTRGAWSAARDLSAESTRGAWATLVVCSSAIFVIGFDTLAFALLLPAIAATWRMAPSAFSGALSAMVVGATLGSTCLAPLGDRLGRRTLLLFAMTGLTATTLGTAIAEGTTQFVIWRFLTGLSMGAAISNATALTSEAASATLRARFVVLMSCCASIGSVFAGLIAPMLIHTVGWRGAFAAAAGVSLVVVLAIFFFVKEGREPSSDPGVARITSSVPTGRAWTTPLPPVWKLFSRDFAPRTAVLWTMSIAHLFSFYFLISWLPVILGRAHWSPDNAIRGSTLIQLGGILGGLLLATQLKSGPTAKWSIVGCYVISFLTLASFSILTSELSWSIALFVLGAAICAAQFLMTYIGTASYPAEIRAAGLGWSSAISGVGSAIAPFAGAWLLDHRIAAAKMLGVLIVPIAVCASMALAVRTPWLATADQ
jgi:AAHS family 4-hydroxybenzoate transporter-like MFS transporter